MTTSILKNVMFIVLAIAIAAWAVANPTATGNLLRAIADVVMYVVGQFVKIIQAALA